MEQGCKVILQLACRKLRDKDTFTKSDPQVFIFMRRFINNRLTEQWEMIGKTEQIKDNLNPNFKATFILDYTFEIKQPIKFEVRDIDGDNYDKLGSVETTVGILFGSKNQTCILDLDLGGKLITMCEKYQDMNELYVMKISGQGVKGSWCSSPNPSFKIYKCVNLNDFFAYESETVHSTNAPQWKIFQMKQFRIGSKFKIELCDSVHKILGNVTITIDELKQGKRQFVTSNGGGTIIFEQFETIIKPSFMDYIQGGTQLNLTIAIDFTGSNGHPNDVGSLHYINGNNQYLQALTSVGEILLAYDYDKMVPCYGFGAVLNYPELKTRDVVHCFPLSGDNNNTSAFQLEGIQQIYQYALKNVHLAGPTYFAPIIEETMKLAQQTKLQEQNQYLVLLILTDGAINDFNLVEQQLERAAFLPMSIIIIGVGDDDFQLMKQLDNDLPPGSAQYSNKRDLVQFVPYKQFSHSMLLAKEVLEELPDQLVSYMELQGIKPKQAPIHNMEQMNVTMPLAQQAQQI